MSLQQYDSYYGYGNDTAADDNAYGDEMMMEEESGSGSMAMMAFGLVPLANLFVYLSVNDDTTSDDWKMVKNLALFGGSAKALVFVADMVMPMPMMPIAGLSLVSEFANLYLINKAEGDAAFADVN